MAQYVAERYLPGITPEELTAAGAEVTVERALWHWPVNLTAHARAGPAEVEGVELSP
jgi:hypothetical protein